MTPSDPTKGHDVGRVMGKVAIVTGAGSTRGLGFATARRLAEEGAAVVLTDIEGAEETAGRITAQGGQAIAVRHDVTDERGWQEVIAATEAAFGRTDVLVNNAGITMTAPLPETSAADFRRVIEINLTGTFLGARAAVEAIRRHGEGGAIVNISSVAGLVGYAMLSGYNASKGGVRLLTKSIALECAAEGIRCNSVHPGKIWTGMLEEAATVLATPDTLAADIPLGRLGETLDIANAVLFLASDEARYITGTEVVVDGGLTAQ